MHHMVGRREDGVEGDSIRRSIAELSKAFAITAFALLGLAFAPIVAAARPIQNGAEQPRNGQSKAPTGAQLPHAPPMPIAVPPMPPAVSPPAPPLRAPMPVPLQSPPSFPVSAHVTGVPLTDPRTWFTDSDYPAEAKRNNQQGRVTIGLYVDPQGKPDRCIVITRSGSSSLDDTSCRLAMMRARFKPAVAPDGTPTGFIYTSSMYWHLADDFDFNIGTQTPDLSKGPIVKTLLRIIVDVDERGRGVACHSGTPAISDADVCADFYPGRQMIDPVKRFGKTVPVTITLTRTVRIDPKLPGK